MRKRRAYLIIGIAVSLAILISVPVQGAGQKSANYAVQADAFGGGGGRVGSTNYKSRGTFAQSSPLGVYASTSCTASTGFWYAIRPEVLGMPWLPLLLFEE